MTTSQGFRFSTKSPNLQRNLINLSENEKMNNKVYNHNCTKKLFYFGVLKSQPGKWDSRNWHDGNYDEEIVTETMASCLEWPPFGTYIACRYYSVTVLQVWMVTLASYSVVCCSVLKKLRLCVGVLITSKLLCRFVLITLSPEFC